ncbi:hypothetical protein [Flavobacterium pectinovorum]|uniref:Uncharacterized protein n=1 Tax=Flavobacterium pectinovorum TaxID=29533 RepID=A0AB36P014_9FLAO|nr:hypothetical protein [Flavobacterium pectinovorum]OXB04393.1 hypothetical protein B0A72_12925 [Flavobacterium pectinovorum]SHL56717.1 hypothetical protein SAMN05444387_0934 [Flavobacterium pectinovorum]
MENESAGFALIAIKTEQFALFEENYSSKKEMNVTTSLEFKINEGEKRIGVFATFTFDQTKKPFVKTQVSCHFVIDPNSWKSFIKNDLIIFPKSFIGHLTMLTIGTARGVLHAKTEGTEFNKFILPVINVNELVDKDAEFTISI